MSKSSSKKNRASNLRRQKARLLRKQGWEADELKEKIEQRKNKR
jgi:hypothetical protein